MRAPRSCRASVAALLLCAASGGSLEAQQPAPRFVRWGAEHGLPHNSVFSLAQDRTGFVWVGTVDGLARFDGHEFVVFRPEPGASGALSQRSIRVLLATPEGVLWVGTEAGLDRYDPVHGRFEPAVFEPVSNSGGARFITALGREDSGAIWVGTDGGLFVGDGTGAFRLSSLPAVAHEVAAIGNAPGGKLFAVVRLTTKGETRLLRLSNGRAEDDGPTVRARGANFLAFDRSGRVWLDSGAPLDIDPLRQAGSTLSASGAPPRLFAFAEEALGTVWMGGEDGLFRWDENAGRPRAEDVRGDEASWLDRSVRALLVDRDGALWVGTYSGLYRYDPRTRPFEIRRHDRNDPDSLALDAVSALLAEPDGTLWIGTFGGGLDRFAAGSPVARHHRARGRDPATLPSDLIWGLHRDRRGTLWVATDAGLAALHRGASSFERIALPLPESTSPPLQPRALFVTSDPAGTVWVATYSGFYAVDPESRAVRRFSVAGETGGPERDNVEEILPAPDGTLWLATPRQGLVRFDPRTGESRALPLVTVDGRVLESETIFDLHTTRDGRLWLATGAGLLRFDEATGRFDRFGREDGLSSAIVYSLLEDQSGRLWLGTARGITRFNPAAPAGHRSRNFELADGIASMELNRRAAAVDRSGRFLFGGVDGLTEFDPAAIADPPAPRELVLTSIAVAGTEGERRVRPEGLAQLVVSHREATLAFEFSALSFRQPPRDRYSYRLEGLEERWVDAGERRLARYAQLAPGEYLFRARAAGPDGEWSESELALPVIVTPPFWRTPVFRIALVLAFAGAIYAFYRLRVARLLAVERLRLAIASDLHDDLSSELAGIALAAEGIEGAPELDHDHREQARAIREHARDAVEAVRDTVWSVNPEHDSMTALVRRLRATASFLAGDRLARFDARGADDRRLDMSTRRELYLITKEALHNAVRHSRASSIAVELDVAADRLRLVVSDDGVGFSPAAARGRGEGLATLERRAQALGARLTIDSTPARGTAVELEMPLPSLSPLPRTRDRAARSKRSKLGRWRPR